MAFLDTTGRLARPARTKRPNLTSLIDLWRSRRALARLDRDGLHDIGIDRKTAAREAARPVWDVPEAWRK